MSDMSDEATSLLPPEMSKSQAAFDVRFGKHILRRGRRLAVVLSERVINVLSPEHKPMGQWASFLFLSNLILGAPCAVTAAVRALHCSRCRRKAGEETIYGLGRSLWEQ